MNEARKTKLLRLEQDSFWQKVITAISHGKARRTSDDTIVEPFGWIIFLCCSARRIGEMRDSTSNWMPALTIHVPSLGLKATNCLMARRIYKRVGSREALETSQLSNLDPEHRFEKIVEGVPFERESIWWKVNVKWGHGWFLSTSSKQSDQPINR